jgi:hypothetical protein
MNDNEWKKPDSIWQIIGADNLPTSLGFRRIAEAEVIWCQDVMTKALVILYMADRLKPYFRTIGAGHGLIGLKNGRRQIPTIRPSGVSTESTSIQRNWNGCAPPLRRSRGAATITKMGRLTGR